MIDATSQAAARSAVRSLQGAFSTKINTVLEKLIHLRLHVEAAIDFPEEEIDFLCNHDLVVTGLWGNVHYDLKKIKQKGVRIAFDAATRPEDEAAQVAVLQADYFFFASDFGDTEELRQKMKELHAKGPNLVIVTLGEKGSLVYDGNDFTFFGIVPCRVVDTMGAGDSYIAGFLKGIMEEKNILDCMKMGAENASQTIGYHGAW